MRWYARPSWRLFWQVVADLFVLTWCLVWWGTGRLVDSTLRALAEPARRTRDLAGDLQNQAADAAQQAGGVPVVGDGLRQPFDGMSGTLRDLAASASEQVTQLEQVATLVGWLVFLMPALSMVAIWLPRRLRFAARTKETLDLVASTDGTQLLALHALATQPLAELRRISPDPVDAWRRGDQGVTAELADLELVTAGVSRPRRRRSTAATLKR